MAAAEITIKGIVQGVGFRPFIYQKAIFYKLKGIVKNDFSGVYIYLEGRQEDLSNFLNELNSSPPPLSVVEEILVQRVKEKGYTSFTIEQSSANSNGLTLLSPDLAVCPDCLKEIDNAKDKQRFHYAFTNCTNCGPRFSIIKNLPYDRNQTTMQSFKMCPSCKTEYEDPLDRRFHAQPTCCKTCGPVLTLLNHQGTPIPSPDPLLTARHLLKEGYILAVKGIGGFHLICSGTLTQTIQTLRSRKNRKSKPLALMMKDLGTVLQYCCLNAKEEAILTGIRKPVLLLEKKGELLPYNIAFSAPKLGVMLPYSPLHYMLFDETLSVLVATSANISGVPMVYKNEDAVQKLNGIADYFLIHNRDIHTPVDDSVVKVVLDEERVIRPARGYAPLSQSLSLDLDSILALGGELKNTFCISNQNYYFMSQYIGDMGIQETLDHFMHTLNHFKSIYRIQPEVIVYDNHPNFWHHVALKELDIKEKSKLIGVYHHHAHIAGCLAENHIEDKVIGIAFDGTGYGEDGQTWGSEFFLCNKKEFKRVGHLDYFKLPGGDMAAIYPSRIGLSLLYEAFGEATSTILPDYLKTKETKLILSMLKNNVACPLCCSMGRLFDGVAALLGFKDKISYEAEACIYLENLAASSPSETSCYPYKCKEADGSFTIDYIPLIIAVMKDVTTEISAHIISRKYHNTLALLILDLSKKLRKKYGLNKIALSGGVFQNELLFTLVYQLLTESRFEVFTHKLIPCNDSGLSFGQMIVASELIRT